MENENEIYICPTDGKKYLRTMSDGSCVFKGRACAFIKNCGTIDDAVCWDKETRNHYIFVKVTKNRQ